MSDKSKLVYICSPYSTGDVQENVDRARVYCRLALKEGFIPVAPHLLYPQFLNDSYPEEREQGLACGLALLEVCAEVWVFDYTDESDGMLNEIQFAFERDIPIKVGAVTNDYKIDLEQIYPFLAVLTKVRLCSRELRKKQGKED